MVPTCRQPALLNPTAVLASISAQHASSRRAHLARLLHRLLDGLHSVGCRCRCLLLCIANGLISLHGRRTIGGALGGGATLLPATAARRRRLAICHLLITVGAVGIAVALGARVLPPPAVEYGWLGGRGSGAESVTSWAVWGVHAALGKAHSCAGRPMQHSHAWHEVRQKAGPAGHPHRPGLRFSWADGSDLRITSTSACTSSTSLRSTTADRRTCGEQHVVRSGSWA